MTGRHEASWVPDTKPDYQGEHRNPARPDARDDLEAAIWNALTAYGVTVKGAREFVESLLLLADSYASSDSERLTELRRQVLHRERTDIGGEHV